MKTLLLAIFSLFILPAAAQAQGFGGNQRNFTVRNFETIRVDGPVIVKLQTGVAPYARATGEGGAYNNVEVDMNGKTLIVSWREAGRRGFRDEQGGPVTVEVGTRLLRAAWMNGSGRLDIETIETREFQATVSGSGALSIASLDVDLFDLGIVGSASARIAGRAKDATMVVRGMSSLDAEALEVGDLTLGVEGPSVVRAFAEDQAKIDAIGVVDIMLAGRAACTLNTQGAARVVGCR